MKKQFGDYFLGFDIGTESVGWAVTDTSYNVLKFNGKGMWGFHLFEEGVSAAERRVFRCQRRRTERIAQRLALLRDLFAPAINDVDSAFYQRLADSKFFAEDKQIAQKNALFADDAFDDKSYHQAYPTIYHLRSQLIHDKVPHDVRLVYLALHHILKHRGHFLFEGQDFATVTSFTHVFEELIQTLNDYDIPFDFVDATAVESTLKNRQLNISSKKKLLYKQLQCENKPQKAVADLLSGGKVQLAVLFDDEALKDSEIPAISLSDSIDEVMDKLADSLGDRLYLVSKLKAVYDWSVLVNILQGNTYLSDAKVAVYEVHKEDLKLLKKMIHTHLTLKDKTEILRTEQDKLCNYHAYAGHGKPCSQKEFCDYLKKKFTKIQTENPAELDMLARLESGTFMPRQVSKDNGVIPYQLHLQECKTILDNAAAYLSFLNDTDSDGLRVADKILSILTFRIPYYVGPLNRYKKETAWIVKRKNEKIYPWNFEDVVDLSQSAEGFILRMTNKCTYLPTEDVLPKQSITYSKYNILNQLNNLRVNGEKLPAPIKQAVFNDLFINVEKPAKVTFSKLKAYFKAKGYFADCEKIELSGVDGTIEGDVKALVQFRKICGATLPNGQVLDEIIQKITILGDSKELLRDHLQDRYSQLFTKDQMKAISRLRFTGWARFSNAFLQDVYHVDEATGECYSILTMLYETNNNLMQLLSKEYTFIDSIDAFNQADGKEIDGFDASILQDLYVSPAVRRGIWRVLSIAKEIVKITGHQPTKIFVEMARDTQGDGKQKKRTVSRKNALLDLYKKCKIDEPKLLAQLEGADEGELRDNRLYLYYSQLGRCMYSGERIDLSQIYTSYDVDHIYPQSKVKDDSLHSNKVLVKRTLNAAKGDQYPIPDACLGKNIHTHWYLLQEKGFISKEKYNRLSRRTGFELDELSGFIARQLVETRQSSKAAAELLQKVYGESEVVYVKAGNVSAFRQQYDIVKSRLVNDLHHAKDAYLNIVVGNVYHEKFTRDPRNFLNKKQVYSMNKVFEYPVKKGDTVAWESEGAKSLIAVKAQVARNNVLFTRYATTNNGGFFDQMPLKAGKGQYPLKTTDPRLCNIQRYGAYNKISSSYYFLVKHTHKKKPVSTIEYVSVVAKNGIRNTQDLQQYAKDTLGLIDPVVLIPKIKINTLFKVNGFYMHLSGRTGTNLSFKGGIPLILPSSLYAYSKKIEKYIERNKEEKAVLPITEHQKITSAENLALYDALTEKLRSSIYNKKLDSQVKTFEQGREKFENLPISDQCLLLYRAFSLFDTSASRADLTIIGGGSQAGTLVISTNLANSEKISIIHQSVTGLFQQEIDLKTL